MDKSRILKIDKVIIFRYILMALAVIINCYFARASDLRSPDSIVRYLFISIPLIFITAFFGSVNANICFLWYFIFLLIDDFQYAYMAVYSLAAILVTSVMMRRRMYKRKFTSFIASMVMAFWLGTIFYILFGMIGRKDFSNMEVTGLLKGFLMAVPTAFLSSTILYLIYSGRFKGITRFIPDIWDVERKFYDRDYKIRSIKNKLTVLIVIVVGVTGMSAVLYANYLIPDVGDMFEAVGEGNIIDSKPDEESNTTDNGENQDPSKEDNVSGDGSEEIKVSGIPGLFEMDETFRISSRDVMARYRFVFNDAAKTFDLKLIMLLMSTVVPLIVLANEGVQRRIAKPVTQMAGAISDFDEGTDEKLENTMDKLKRVKVNTKDEIQILYEAIDHYMKELSEYMDKFKEEQKLEEELRVAKATSDAKSSFLSNMSHEIRTPINAVLGMDEMILRESENEAILEYANNIKVSGNTLLSLVNDILDFSKIEAGKMEIIPVEYELSSVINDLINMISVKAKDKGLELNVDVDPSTPHILYGDEIRIKQCATNILSNAVKYTEKGSVTLKVGYKEDDTETVGDSGSEHADNILLTVRVTDTGIGIKEEDIKKLFSPFERIEEKRNRNIEGTGLGMNIVRQLLDLMDTQLNVKSVYGNGSDFYFEVRQKVISREPVGDFNETYRRFLENREKYEVSFKAPEGKILVIDDTPMNLTVIKGLLKETRLKIDTGVSGKEALKLVRENKYDVIFLDHMMPEPDGIQTRKAFDTLEGNLNMNTPCIALTANAVSGAREMYLEAGFDDYISKPVDGIKLEKLLMELIPDEKLILPGDEGYSDKDTENAGSKREGENILRELEGIDYGSAIKNCLSEDVLREAIEDFHVSIMSEPDLIEKALMDGDIRTYTIKVHALKSSARIIGALELSKMAGELEAAGNEGNTERLNEKTPELLSLYRSYEQKLSKLCKKDEDEDKPVIDEEELGQAYECLMEFAQSFDFDSADEVLNSLSNYRLPVDKQGKYDKIKQAVINVDRDELIRLLSKQ
ncbi:MAG: response regulator [Lachnospiraceae bacterium]|nr:response regulator [Lachnospiraceae bacterium]